MKSIIRSKTFWTNVFGAVAAAVNGPLGDVVPPEALVYTWAALNIGLRFVTDEPVSLTGR